MLKFWLKLLIQNRAISDVFESLNEVTVSKVHQRVFALQILNQNSFKNLSLCKPTLSEFIFNSSRNGVERMLTSTPTTKKRKHSQVWKCSSERGRVIRHTEETLWLTVAQAELTKKYWKFAVKQTHNRQVFCFFRIKSSTPWELTSPPNLRTVLVVLLIQTRRQNVVQRPLAVLLQQL